MSNEIKIKSNGLRNELKEIRKSIDTLTHALHIMIETQTHKHNEKLNNSCPDSSGDKCYCEDETGRTFGI